AAKRKPAPRPKPSRARGCLYNLLTLVFLALTAGALAYGVHLFQNPYSVLNPLPPATPLPIVITATPEPPAVVVTTTPASALTTQEAAAPAETATAGAPTATYTPLPPEMLTELAPAPTQEQFTGEQAPT